MIQALQTALNNLRNSTGCFVDIIGEQHGDNRNAVTVLVTTPGGFVMARLCLIYNDQYTRWDIGQASTPEIKDLQKLLG